jgi:hypothetical protein
VTGRVRDVDPADHLGQAVRVKVNGEGRIIP